MQRLMQSIKLCCHFSNTLLFFLFTLLCASCANSQDMNNKTKFPHNARFYIQTEPLSLDPRLGGDKNSQTIIRTLFDGLMRLDAQGIPQPAVAKSVEISDDKLTYTFRLRTSMWSNTDPVTAHDFDYAWKSILDPLSSSNFGYAFFLIKNAKQAKEGKCSTHEIGICAIDDLTLQVTLEHPAPYFLELVANPLYCPVNHIIAQKNPYWHADVQSFVSNGPFQLTEWKHQTHLQLSKSSSYWNPQHAHLKQISLSVIPDANSGLSLFEQGAFDWAGDPMAELPPDAIPTLKAEKRLFTQDIGSVFWMEFNTSHPLFQNSSIRQAFSKALNRTEITEQLLQGDETPAYSILPQCLTLQNPSLSNYHDIEEARVLFQKGLKELKIDTSQLPSITLSHSMKPGQKALAETIQQQWQKAFKVPIQIRSVEWNTYFNEFATHQFDIAGSSWVSWFNDPIYNLEYLKYKDNGLNATLWENKEYTNLLERANQEPDPSQRKELLRKAEEIVLSEAPIIPVYYNPYKFLKNPALKGIVISPMGQIDLTQASLSP